MVIAAALLLSLASIGAGLFSGFVVAMASVVQAMLDDLNCTEYTCVMQRIIARGRESVVVKVLLLGKLLVGVVAMVLAWPQRGVFVLALVGWVVFFVGALLVSRQMAEPLYDIVMSWDVQAPPPDWEHYRRRWHQINWISSGAAFVAFCLFGAAAHQTLAAFA